MTKSQPLFSNVEGKVKNRIAKNVQHKPQKHHFINKDNSITKKKI